MSAQSRSSRCPSVRSHRVHDPAPTRASATQIPVKSRAYKSWTYMVNDPLCGAVSQTPRHPVTDRFCAEDWWSLPLRVFVQLLRLKIRQPWKGKLARKAGQVCCVSPRPPCEVRWKARWQLLRVHLSSYERSQVGDLVVHDSHMRMHECSRDAMIFSDPIVDRYPHFTRPRHAPCRGSFSRVNQAAAIPATPATS